MLHGVQSKIKSTDERYDQNLRRNYRQIIEVQVKLDLPLRPLDRCTADLSIGELMSWEFDAFSIQTKAEMRGISK